MFEMMPVGILFALISAVSFASLGVFVKLMYAAGFSPFAALAWRFIFASLFLWCLFFFAKRGSLTLRKFFPVFLLGVFGFSVQAGLFFATVRYLDVSLAALLLYLYPAFVVIFGRLFHHKSASTMQVIAVFVSFLGGVLALKPGSLDLNALGVGFGLACALWYSNYLLVSERILKNVEAYTATASLSLGAALVFSSLAVWRGELVWPHRLWDFALIAGLSIVATVVPIVTLFAAIRRIGAARASLVSSFEIVPTVVAGKLIMGDKLHWVQWLGAMFIVASVVFIQWEFKRENLHESK